MRQRRGVLAVQVDDRRAVTGLDHMDGSALRPPNEAALGTG
jgi:hypothetical protein